MTYWRTVEATGISPLASVTIGYHEPAVVLVTEQMIWEEVEDETVQACLANCTVIPVVEREVPVIVRQFPERLKPVICADGTVYE